MKKFPELKPSRRLQSEEDPKGWGRERRRQSKLQVPDYAHSEAPREKREEPEVPKDIHGAGNKMAEHHRQDSKAEWRVLLGGRTSARCEKLCLILSVAKQNPARERKTLSQPSK